MIDIQKNLNTRDLSAKVAAELAKSDTSEMKSMSNPPLNATGMDKPGVKQAIGV